MELEINQLDLRYASCRIVTKFRQSQLVAALAREGQQSPVLIVAEEEGGYLLIDGYGRVAALESLACDVVQAIVLDMAPAEALLQHRLGASRKPSALEEAWLLSTLIGEHGQSQAKLAVVLGRSRSWISRRLALLESLPIEAQEAVRRGKLSPQIAMKYLVPLARANRAQCVEVVSKLKGSPSVRQIGELYRAWRHGDKEQRTRIAEAPMMFLRTLESGDPEQDEAQSLLKDFSLLAAISVRATRRLEEEQLSELSDTGRNKLRRRWNTAKNSFATLSEHFEQKATSAGT